MRWQHSNTFSLMIGHSMDVQARQKRFTKFWKNGVYIIRKLDCSSHCFILPPYQNICRCWLSHNFDHSSYSKNYCKHVKRQVELEIHTTEKYIANKINCICKIFWIRRMVKVVTKSQMRQLFWYGGSTTQTSKFYTLKYFLTQWTPQIWMQRFFSVPD
jgi:hypothetical protein